ncbi:MAG: zinc-ribbon domain-containing protein [Pseudomonadota bacterium]
MRITCPNCSSQYEVAEDAIPPAGRDVQCAKCSHIWFQASPAAPMMLDDVAPAEAAAPAGATFRSARVDRSAEPAQSAPAPAPEVPQDAPVASAAAEPAAAPQATAEIAQPEPAPVSAPAEVAPPTSLTEDIKRILTEERAYSAPDGAAQQPVAEQPNPTAAPVTEQPAPPAEPEQPAPAAAELSLDAAPRMFDTPPPAEPIAPAEPETPAAPPAAEPAAEAPQTLQEARSLREVLDAESAGDTVATVTEPTLQDLGLRRPQQPAPAPEPIPTDIPEAPETRARDAFTNIDDLNSKLDAQSQPEGDADTDISLGGAVAPKDTSSFSTGFAVACFICISAALLYLVAPQIAQSVPSLAGVAEGYAANVDSGRMVIQELYYGGAGEPGFPNFFDNIMSNFR